MPAGLPGGGTTCTPSTNPVTLQNSSPSTVTLVVSTFPRVTTTADARPARGLYALATSNRSGLPGLGSEAASGRPTGGVFVPMALAVLLLLQPACGGHSSSTTTTGTPAGTYTITVSATSGSFTQTIPITLVVQ